MGFYVKGTESNTYTEKEMKTNNQKSTKSTKFSCLALTVVIFYVPYVKDDDKSKLLIIL